MRLILVILRYSQYDKIHVWNMGGRTWSRLAIRNTWSEVGWPSETLEGNKTPHDDVIKWKHFPRYSPFVRGIHRSPVISPHKGQWRGALMFSLTCAWINGWVNNRKIGDLRRHHGHNDVTIMAPLYHWLSNMNQSSVTYCTLYSVNVVEETGGNETRHTCRWR